ncbi:LSU ribosomal protein L13p (L13Ae) [hydrothermal vent metagenome]|uniref:LSU ribosomal protein L13p (L13Ae) n=1 Tax=hydrothermal vent metagenome TaxID=652676 RepID=A0A3B1D092_9ZZZZ
MKTTAFKKIDVQEKWFIVDAKDKILGRMATEVASILRGKHKTTFTPNQDLGDHVIVINAEKIAVTGKKETNKIYYHHTGYIGGIKSTTLKKLRAEKPERIVQFAIQGMLPKTKLGNAMAKKLKVYAGESHPHRAQQPEVLQLSS